MKILVLGASGMAGHLLSVYFQERGYSVTGFSRKRLEFCSSIVGDALDTVKLLDTLLTVEYDVVINCIGILNTEAEQKRSEAVYLNSYLPHVIARTIANRKTKLIHMSTDCVFAGNTGPYFEDSLRDGLSFYDRSKALGEIEDEKNVTFRNSIVGPDINDDGIGLFNWFMKQDQPIVGYQGAIWTGVTTLELARAMEHAITTGTTGLYNLVNNKCISKYELLVLFNKHFRDDKIEIKPSDSFQLDKSLKSKRLINGFSVKSYEQMVIDMKHWMETHKNLYPKYYS